MDAVRAFNNELSSLYETRPPVSRAKMASVTKSAIKAIKFYKHVVQSVEKFVMKCKPEYKIPGLYVVDSIVRQSRHQFGSEKDVFGPRFTKNIVTTFQSLLKCPPDEKCRVIRVLNLWQKNAVFPMEVIQPLLDMAANPTNTDSVLAAQRAVEKVVQAHQRSLGKASNGGTEESLLAQQSDIVNTVTKLLQQTGEGSLLASGQEVQLQQLQLLQQQLVMHTEMMSSKPQQTPPVIDNNLLAQIKLLTDQLLSKTDAPSGGPPTSQPPSAVPPVPPHGMNEGLPPVPEPRKQPELSFNRKLLDFDYGDSDEEDDRKDGQGMHHHPLPGGVQKLLNDPSLMQHIHNVSSLQSDHLRTDMQDPDAMRKHHLEQQQEQFNKEIGQSQYSNYNQDPDVIVVEDQDDRDSRDFDRDRRRSRRSRDRSRSRSPRRRRHSRSRSRERRRSRDRHRRSRSRDLERERQREKDRDRKKKGLPPIKEKHISICSTTLWFGHLAKHTTEDELRAAIENYGTVETIKMVPPRGCAFVSMTWRKDAAKALDRMKGYKLNSSALRVAWAPNIGVKESHFKDLWDVELGVTYIPWSKMSADLTPLLSGAVIDDETLPDHLKGSMSGRPDEDSDMRPSQPVDNHIPPPSVNQQMPNYGGHNQPIPSSQQMTMIPPPMMMPPPGQMPHGVGMPPPTNVGQMMPGQMMPGQGPPQQMPPNLLQPPDGQVSTAMSLSGGVSLPQVVSAATSLQGGPPGMLSSQAPTITMERPPVMPFSCSSPLIMQGQQQGILSRPGFAHQSSPFGLHGLRPGFPLGPGQGLRPPFHMEEPKEWPSDDKLEEEALAEMEDEDSDQPLDLPAPGPGPTLMSFSTMMGMRMRLPGPGGPGGGPPRMPMQMPGGSPRPGMMVEMGPPVSNAGMPLGGMMGRPGMVGPRVLPPGSGPPGPQDGPEGMVGRPPMPQGMMAQGGIGMRMGMGGQGPRGLNPGGMPLGPRALGMPGSPGLRGLGPGQGPIRIVLGQRPNLVRPGGPFGFDTPPHPRLQPLGDGGPPTQPDRNPLDDGPPGPGPGPNPNNGPQGPGLLPGLMMGAALRGGRPGLLGARPNMPVNGGFRFGPGGLNFRGPRPDFLRGPALDSKPVVMEGSQGSLPTPFVGGPPPRGNNSSPQYGEGDNSPEYGEFLEKEDAKVAAAHDTDLRSDTDLRTDTDLRPQDTDLRGNNGGVGADSDARRLIGWGSGEGESANPASQDGLVNTNGPTPKADSLPVASQDSLGAASNANQTAPDALEGASEG